MPPKLPTKVLAEEELLDHCVPVPTKTIDQRLFRHRISIPFLTLIAPEMLLVIETGSHFDQPSNGTTT